MATPTRTSRPEKARAGSPPLWAEPSPYAAIPARITALRPRRHSRATSSAGPARRSRDRPLEVDRAGSNLESDELPDLLPGGGPGPPTVESSGIDEREADPEGRRRRARRAHHRPGRREARRRGGAAQPLAPPAAAGGSARGGNAQEHPDDRAHRLRQDRDQPAPRQARRRAVRQGRGD